MKKPSKTRTLKIMVSIMMVLIPVMLWQLPVETVFAEGEGEVPEFLITLDNAGLTNITFQLTNAEIGFELNNQTYTFEIKTAVITIIEAEIDNDTRQITIYLNIDGVKVDIPEIKLTLNHLLLEMTFTIHGNKSVFKVLGKTYVPIYKLAQTAIETAIS